MTTGEHLVELSSLSGTQTALDHFLSIDTSGSNKPAPPGKVVYVVADKVVGVVTKPDYLLGNIDKNVAKGGLEKTESIRGTQSKDNSAKGTSSEDSLKGKINNNTNIKGKSECQ